MLKRWLFKDLEAAMKVRRGVNLTGARQVGKSTLAEMLELPNAKRYTFDDKFIRAAAANDPTGFVKHEPGQTMIIDEVQKVPDILDAVKIVLDHDNTPGQYLLTGSSNIRFAKMVRDSLAGRLRTIRLRSLALGEILGNEVKQLNAPNLVAIFVGLFLGVVLGAIPIFIPGMSVPVDGIVLSGEAKVNEMFLRVRFPHWVIGSVMIVAVVAFLVLSFFLAYEHGQLQLAWQEVERLTQLLQEKN